MCGAQWAFRTPVPAIDLDVKYQCLQIQLWFRAPNSWFGASFHPRLLLGGLWNTSRYLQMTRKRNINSLKVKNNLHYYGEAISSCQVALYKCNGLKIRVPQIVAMDWFGQKKLGKKQTPESPECLFVRNLWVKDVDLIEFIWCFGDPNLEILLPWCLVQNHFFVSAVSLAALRSESRLYEMSICQRPRLIFTFAAWYLTIRHVFSWRSQFVHFGCRLIKVI